MKDNVPYIATTKKDLSEMLLEIGVKEIDDLYEAIPQKLRLNRDLILPSPLKKLTFLFQKSSSKDTCRR